jgi:hypothetical protein
LPSAIDLPRLGADCGLIATPKGRTQLRWIQQRFDRLPSSFDDALQPLTQNCEIGGSRMQQTIEMIEQRFDRLKLAER